MRRGVHWHSRSHAGAHFVMLSSIAGPDVLAHELGHYLGNPEARRGAGNLMSYGRSEPSAPDSWTARMNARASRAYLRRGELRGAEGAQR